MNTIATYLMETIGYLPVKRVNFCLFINKTVSFNKYIIGILHVVFARKFTQSVKLR